MKLYNSLTKSKEELQPISNKNISIYVCGITPYDTTHLGHAFTYISFDLLIRILNIKGYEINYTQNVTDINDRDGDILKRAKEQNKNWQDLSKFWTNLFLSDMEYLNWIKPDHYLFASEQISQMVDLIQRLIKNNIAYKNLGSVYLNIEKVKNFGKLSRLNYNQMIKLSNEFEEGTNNKQKLNPLDITLWRGKEKNQLEHIPFFESPFGLGRPGWHIECSAMAVSSLGEQIVIHGGGRDLIYPHHEAEIAQSEGATQKIPFAKFWMHTGQVSYKGEKMSKSLGNLVMVSKLKNNYSANAIRLMLLLNHYRNDWEYKDEQIVYAEKLMKLITNVISKKNNTGLDITIEFMNYLEDDLNFPDAFNFLLINLNLVNPKRLKVLLKNLGFNF